jgi:aspartokinase-like uncharacterized kinase
MIDAISLWVLDPIDFMDHVDGRVPGQRLPVGWHVTSDSIAARVADVVGASELVLLKSKLPDGGESSEFVDEYFETAAANLSRLRAVNLRDPGFPECVLKGQS